jgi:hypothetical protein
MNSLVVVIGLKVVGRRGRLRLRRGRRLLKTIHAALLADSMHAPPFPTDSSYKRSFKEIFQLVPIPSTKAKMH